jgi:phosphatidylethanolamine/phosphatidyl-N-methylethanolamine N-methyltransferase
MDWIAMTSHDQRDGEDPDDIVRDWYNNYYSLVSATGDGSLFHRYIHRAMERRFDESLSFERVLEVGGNRGEHIPFVHHAFTRYVLTDLYPPKLDATAERDPRIRAHACDVAALPYVSASFDRVIATCLLHHVNSPFRAAQEMRRVTKGGGVITIFLPTDPGLAYRVGKAATSGRAARRQGLSDVHRLLGALDHKNHFTSIREQLRHVFRVDDVSVDWLPWRVPSLNLNAFAVFTIVKACA